MSNEEHSDEEHHHHRIVARQLTLLQRDLLVDHACAPQPMDVSSIRGRSQMALVGRKLLKPWRLGRDPDAPSQTGTSGGHNTNIRPNATALTDYGKEVACAILGQYADALTRAGSDYEKRLLPRRFKNKEEETDANVAEGPDVRQL
jgi:hypothetical protein